MAAKAAQKAAEKKAAKQKKILMVLAIPAAFALYYAYSTFSSMGSQPAAAPVTVTPVGQTTPTSGIPTATPQATVTPGIAAPKPEFISSFVALGRKDPFNDHGPKTNPSAGKGSGSSSSGGSSKSGGKSKNTDGGGGSKTKQPPPVLTGAVISLNGTKLSLAIGNEFGHAPGLSGVSLFRLISVTPRSAVVGVVGTKQQFTLHVLSPLVLEQNGGWRYTLILEPLGSAAPMTTVPQTATTTPGN